jgi:hypothetical protein
VSKSPLFEWAPLAGAASYRIQIANNEQFTGAITATTDATRYTPVSKLNKGTYLWRVQMTDADGKTGPYALGRVHVGETVYLPMLMR